jgi:hypothetical protein
MATTKAEVKEEVKQETRKREKRRPFGVPVSRLGVSKEIEGYHLRWINDEPGRIALAQESGYEFVTPEEVGRADEGTQVKEHVGTGRDDVTPMYAYLMKIPMEWYLEDKQARDLIQDQFDDAIRKGQLERRAGDGRYVPDGGISYKTK